NMVSVPRIVSENQTSALFPTAISTAYEFAGRYQPVDSFVNGKGYWLKFDAVQTVSYVGVPNRTDTIPVIPRWNMIGSIEVPIDPDAILQEPPGNVLTNYIGYDDGYYPASTIEPGKAYWVKTRNAGTLTLNVPSTTSPVASKKEKSELENLNVITVEPRSENNTSGSHPKKLYFGKKNSDELDLEKYELPPSPPAGALDIRFSTNRFVELISNKINEPREIPLSIQYSDTPLELSWSMNETDGLKYIFIERKGMQVVSQCTMKETGSITIHGDGQKTYAVRAEQIPTEYSLHQNYPNPFNPATAIQFDVPAPSVVTLKVFSVLGQEVVVLLDSDLREAGTYEVTFDASQLPSGLYFYRISAEGKVGRGWSDVKKMILMK
ncbi:MAG: T9SS type A sorting domain-containing protein, partial [Ignavibacteriae bacterium]|nr:T9SS type A sorting domain-containing protein [Ignavibacteriota bacterium]